MLKEDDTHDLRKHYKWETVMTTAGMTAPPKVTDDKKQSLVWTLDSEDREVISENDKMQ